MENEPEYVIRPVGEARKLREFTDKELRYDRIPLSGLKELYRCVTIGAEKYKDQPLIEVDPAVAMEKIKRHLDRYEKGERVDVEGFHPLSAVAIRCIQIIMLDLEGMEKK